MSTPTSPPISLYYPTLTFILTSTSKTRKRDKVKLLAAMRAPPESVPIMVLLRQKKKAGEDVKAIADAMLAAAGS